MSDLERRVWERSLSARGHPGARGDGERGGAAGGGSKESQAKYYTLASIKKELEQVHQFFRQNPLWPVISECTVTVNCDLYCHCTALPPEPPLPVVQYCLHMYRYVCAGSTIS